MVEVSWYFSFCPLYDVFLRLYVTTMYVYKYQQQHLFVGILLECTEVADLLDLQMYMELIE